MKTKKLILLPLLSLVITSCAQEPSPINKSTRSSDTPLSGSKTSLDGGNDANKSSSLTDEDIADIDFSSSISNTPVGINYPITANDLDGVEELRSPSNLNHHFSYLDVSPSFIVFRDKMKYFSNKLSDYFVKTYFEDDKNFVLSPLSIEMCLGLAIRSAEGETRDEILAAFDMDYETFNTNYKLYFDYLFEDNKNSNGEIISQLLLTNSIWIDDGITLKNSGLDALRDDYYCYSYDVDFSGDNANANKAISEFISRSTNGMLKPDLNLSPETLFVLMNTLYFKSIWNDAGSNLPYAPAEYKFTNSDGSESDKRLLDGDYYKGKPIVTDDYSCFYTGLCGGYRLYFVKPNEGKELKEVFNEDAMNYVLSNGSIVTFDDEKREEYSTQCYFPEFSTYGEFDLIEALKEGFGIESLFNNTCNMSPLTDGHVRVDESKHLAKLDVNKKGVEGAAVTYMATRSIGEFPDQYAKIKDTFVVDKEFGFILTSGNDVLFSGVVNNID